MQSSKTSASLVVVVVELLFDHRRQLCSTNVK